MRLPANIIYPALILSLLFVSTCSSNKNQSPPPPPPQPPTINLMLFVGGFDAPVGIEHAKDGTGRVFVVERAGRIRIISNGALEPTPYLDITSLVSCCGEQGLLGLAFPPNFPAKQHFYVNYTDVSGNTVVSRYRVSPDNPDRALSGIGGDHFNR